MMMIIHSQSICVFGIVLICLWFSTHNKSCLYEKQWLFHNLGFGHIELIVGWKMTYVEKGYVDQNHRGMTKL